MYPHSRYQKDFLSLMFLFGIRKGVVKGKYCSVTNEFPFSLYRSQVMNYMSFFSLWRGQQIYQLLGKLIPVVWLQGELKKAPNELQGVDGGSKPAPLPMKPRQVTRGRNHLWPKHKLKFKVCIS